MKRVLVGVCFCTVLAVAPASAPWAAAGEHGAKAEIQKIYDNIGKALEKKDIEGISKYSLPDARVKYADDLELTLKEWQERARKGWASIKETKARFVVETVKVDGDVAVATYAEALDMLVADPKDQHEDKISYKARWRVILKKTPAGWRTSQSTELERRVTRNGEVIDQRP